MLNTSMKWIFLLTPLSPDEMCIHKGLQITEMKKMHCHKNYFKQLKIAF